MAVTAPARIDGPPKSREELLRRLEEAEETIRAIREGEVDALVVQGLTEDQVFTLHGGDYSFRAFMETMGHGAAALNAKGEILYANAVLTTFIGKPLAQLQGSVFATHFEPSVATQIWSLLEEAKRSGDSASSCEIDLWQEGENRHFLAAAEPLEIGVVRGWALTFTDLTDKVRAEKSVAAERAVRAIISSANEAMLVCDLAGQITYANAAVSAIKEGSLPGRMFSEAIPLHLYDTALTSDELVRIAVNGDAVQGIEAHAPEAPRAKHLLMSAAPISPSDGVINGCVITLIDLSHRKAAEERQNLLMAELDHRVKNTLTIVLAILQTTNDKDIASFRDTFSGRVHALAATHHLLSASSWSDLSLEKVFSVELEPFVNGFHDRAQFEGPELLLKPRAAIAIGLVFHELATNAVKYGALSIETGRVALTVRQTIDNGLFTIEWQESGGPKVAEPERQGFGRKLIASSLRYLPGGGADIEFQPNGLKCWLRLPSEDVLRVVR
jgi:two-component sensor histidine kinase